MCLHVPPALLTGTDFEENILRAAQWNHRFASIPCWNCSRIARACIAFLNTEQLFIAFRILIGYHRSSLINLVHSWYICRYSFVAWWYGLSRDWLADGQRLLRILENDLILKHDTIWPHGLDNSLHIDTPIEVAEFRRSCLRHRWPPEYDTAAQLEPELDLNRLRLHIASTPACDLVPSPTLFQLSTPVAVGNSALPRSNNSGTASRGVHKDDSNTGRPGTINDWHCYMQ